MVRSIDALVEEQVRRWRVARQADRQQATPPPPAPVITVSREYGSQGARIGQVAAGKLGFEFWDQELVHAIAERSGAPDKLIESLDEHSRGDLEDLIAASTMGDRRTEYYYVRQLHRVIHTIHKHGHAVIIGRGAQFILDPSECLRVRVFCPIEQRVADYAKRHGMSRDDADAEVRRVERDRRAFIRHTFDRDVTDENCYDLLLNSGQYGVEPAADVVVAAYRAKLGAELPGRARASAGAGR